MTMGNSWSYVPGDVYKPANEVVEKLVDIVSKGGNYLLNIGPGPDGDLDPAAYQRLKEIGAWMKINSEAIYNTRMFSVFSEGDKIRFTQSKDGKTKYILLFDFPAGKISLSKMHFTKDTKLQMLGSSSKISWKQNGNVVDITIPASAKQATDHVWVLKAVN
jgi:alpha-L-fucosidase